MGIWQVLFLGRTADEAWAPMQALPPVDYFRDASCGPSVLPLTIMDVIQVGAAFHATFYCTPTFTTAREE